jgi:hypothetical protein
VLKSSWIPNLLSRQIHLLYLASSEARLFALSMRKSPRLKTRATASCAPRQLRSKIWLWVCALRMFPTETSSRIICGPALP